MNPVKNDTSLSSRILPGKTDPHSVRTIPDNRKDSNLYQFDWVQFRILFRLFSRLDIRRGRDNKKKRRFSPLTISLFIYGCLGASMAGSLVHQTVFVYTLLTLSYAMVMAASAVILEMSQNLLYPEEAEVLLYRPIHSRTYFWAKLANLLFFVAIVTLALVIAPALIGLGLSDSRWYFPFVYLPVALLAGGFSAAFVSLIYSLLMRLLDEQKLKDVIAIFQVGLSFVLIFSFQMIPRMFLNGLDLTVINKAEWWLFLLPPGWFAGLVQVGLSGLDRVNLLLSLLALAGMGLLFIFGFRRYANLYLNTIRQEKPDGKKAGTRAKDSTRGPDSFLNPEQRAGYALTAAMMKRDRSVRMGTFAILGMPLAMLTIQVLEGNIQDPFSASFEFGVGQSGAVFMVFYFWLFQYLGYIYSFSRDWEASWIYDVAPIVSANRLLQGQRLMIFFRVVLPFTLLVVVVFGFLLPLESAIKHALFLSVAGLPAFSLGGLKVQAPPFSRERTHGGRLGRIWIMLMVLPIFGLVVWVQSFAYRSEILYWISLFGFGLFFVILEWANSSLAKRRKSWRTTT